jgi:hypothetical protein
MRLGHGSELSANSNLGRDQPDSDSDTPVRSVRWRHSGFFPRSFVFSLDGLADSGELLSIPVPQGSFAISPDYEWHISVRSHSFVLLVGYCIDLRFAHRNTQEVVESLLETALQGGAPALLAEADHHLGRYTVIAHLEGEWIVFNDACATRSTYYADGAPIVASHSNLVGEILGRAPRAQMFRHYRFGLPGNASPVPGVRMLPANMALDIRHQTLSRFWPRADRAERPVKDVYDSVERTLIQSAEAIAKRWRPAISLTAGFDSRTTLAAFRHLSPGAVFTYDRGVIDEVDVAIAREICQRLNIHHTLLPSVGPDEAEEVYAAVKAMTDYTHFEAAAATYLSAFPDGDCIHVRSNLAEIGSHRSWFQPPPSRFNASRWNAVLTDAERKHEPQRNEALRYLQEEMKRLLGLLGYDPSNPRKRTLRGYDAWDLLYWEHRLSTWHSRVLLGSDFAFDTATLFNSRRLLELLLSVPLKDRTKGTLFRSFIAKRCPELADVPINPRSKLEGLDIRAAFRVAKRYFPISAIDRFRR